MKTRVAQIVKLLNGNFALVINYVVLLKYYCFRLFWWLFFLGFLRLFHVLDSVIGKLLHHTNHVEHMREPSGNWQRSNESPA